MSIYKFRILVDIEEDVFKDIEIEKSSTFEELHNTILNAFEFRGDQMASFYMSDDEWNKGLEIGLMDMSFGEEQGPATMKEAKLEDYVEKADQKIIYLYDFLKMWIFYIELIDQKEFQVGLQYPLVSLEIGENPGEDDKQMPDLFEGVEEPGSDLDSEIDDILNEYNDDFSSEGFENIDDLDI